MMLTRISLCCWWMAPIHFPFHSPFWLLKQHLKILSIRTIIFIKLLTEISPWINWDDDAAWASPWICETETGTVVDEVFSVLLVVGPNPFSALIVMHHLEMLWILTTVNMKLCTRGFWFHLGLIETMHELVLELVEWNLATMLLSFSYQLLWLPY